MRRLLMIALSLSMTLALSAAALVAQEAKQDEPKKVEKTEEVKKAEAPKADAPKAEAPKADAPKAEEPPKSIPPEVQAKIDAARQAVAEAIVAAEEAGLLETTLEPPSILDVLILGRSNDVRELKKSTAEKPEVGLYPEAFGAFFTNYAKMDGIDPMKNVRIADPSKGLIEYYNKRAQVFNPLIAAIKKAKADAAKPKEEPKKEEAKKEEPKPEPKPEEKKAEEPKKEEAPKAEAPKDAPKEEPKAEAPKDAPKEEPKKDGGA